MREWQDEIQITRVREVLVTRPANVVPLFPDGPPREGKNPGFVMTTVSDRPEFDFFSPFCVRHEFTLDVIQSDGAGGFDQLRYDLSDARHTAVLIDAMEALAKSRGVPFYRSCHSSRYEKESGLHAGG